MKIRLVPVFLIAVSTVFAAPAFASGYGPAPFYNPAVGAPASQRGQNLQTVGAERADATDAQSGYGGVVAGKHESGGRISRAWHVDPFGRH
ncbi:hypothetical protein [Paraburkholderia oxyphila]|uniref:hypothetical protein n=1 Tax=Paraburkholderia oxyphila TaxID=614212 RepID=UPI0009FC120D|nr:hypothetical protein [Paraburkholderia oxyphila]